MASITMTSSFLGGAAAAITKQLPTTTTNRHRPLVLRASVKTSGEGEKNIAFSKNKEESSNGRRELVFGGGVAAVAAAFSFSKIALADDTEPKRGTPEAKKKYAPVCVTMPTARVCRK